jgi:hypothetical protein
MCLLGNIAHVIGELGGGTEYVKSGFDAIVDIGVSIILWPDDDSSETFHVTERNMMSIIEKVRSRTFITLTASNRSLTSLCQFLIKLTI